MSGNSDGVEHDAKSKANDTATSAQLEPDARERLLAAVSAETFNQWYQEREFARNIREGTPYFNGPSQIKSSRRHSPSQLLQCHRKLGYRQENAPEEQPDPTGIFWFGTRFEEDIVFPFFREVLTDESTYVRNSDWVDYTETTAVGDIRIKGATDPLIVDAGAVPILPSEIKTKESIETLDSPNKHHRAQLHAYVRGLNQKYEIELEGGLIVYGSRKSLDLKSFYVEFDPDFWTETVLQWAEEHTEFRLNNTLPPADPVYDWECQFCSYRERCGQGETTGTDAGTIGLVPAYREYPRAKLVDYFEAHPDARLPPSLVDEFPQLAAEYGIYDWRCQACDSTTAYESAHSNQATPLSCPDCGARGVYAELTSPSPAEQQQQIESASEEDVQNA